MALDGGPFQMKSEAAYVNEPEIDIKSETVDEGFEVKPAADEHTIVVSLTTKSGIERSEEMESQSGIDQHSANSFEMKSETDSITAALTFAQHAKIKNGKPFEMNSSESRTNTTCETCGKTFANRNSYSKHVKAHFETYFCEVCGKSFNRKSCLNKHNRMHQEKKIGCHICGKEFSSMDEKYIHLKEDHDVKRSEVYSPEFKITAVKRMKEIGLVNAASELHVWESTLVDWQHLIFNPWNCTFCGKAFARENNMKAHEELVHKNVKQYLCGKCGEGYASNKAKRNQFACEKCGDPLVPAEESDAAPANDAEDQQGVNLRELFMETFSFNDIEMRTSANRTDLNCGTCNKVFTNKDALMKHMKTHFEKFDCQVCGKTFNRPDILKRHIKIHEQKKTGCHLCGKEFTSTDEKYHHLKEVHDIKRSEIYSQDFKTHAVKRMKDIGLTNAANELYILESTLADWYRLVFSPLYCTICGRTFARENKLKDHVELVHVVTKQNANNKIPLKKQEADLNLQELYMQKYFPGENCFDAKGIEGIVEVEMRVGGEESIDDHEDRKTDENHQLLEKDEINNHGISLEEATNKDLIEESHFIQTIDEVFPCDVCHKTLSTKRGLEKHMIVVHQEKNHICNICTKAFGRKEHLARHVQDMHNTFDKPYKCDKCDDCFKRPDGLAKHIRFVHNKEKNFTCQYCTKTFGNKSSFVRHVADVHEQSGSHVCDYCPRRFLKALDKKKHERKHTGEKPYKCEKCNISYKGSACLKKHLKTCIGNSTSKLEIQKQSSEVKIDQSQIMIEMKGEDDDEILAKEEPMDDIKDINAEKIEDEYDFVDIEDTELETNVFQDQDNEHQQQQ